MKICNITDLVNQEHNVIFINALVQFWCTSRSFQCIKNPKKQNLFLLLKGCKVRYIDKTGKEACAKSGEVIYVPQGSEYKVELYDFEDEASHTIGVNFHILDQSGEQVVMTEDITVFSQKDVRQMEMLFNAAVRSDLEGLYIQSKIILLRIIYALSSVRTNKISPIVEKAIEFWTKNIQSNPSIAETAKLCNVSEVYFRRIFKQEKGITPNEFRREMRMLRAASYLEFSDATVQEISDLLGYSGVSYFIGAFKEKYGCSPLKFRKTLKNQ